MTVSRAVKQFGSTSESAQQSDVQWETSYPYAILPKKVCRCFAVDMLLTPYSRETSSDRSESEQSYV